jgi:pimeloyl-ACP methyl ester carboxylesterase
MHPETMPSADAIAVDGARIAYEIGGSGPPLVLIHGSLLDRRLWDEQVPAFARQFRVLRYDARGHGESPSDRVTYAHHRDLHILLRTLGIARAIVVGLSMGGRVAQHLALTHPELVSALVLVGAAADGATVTAAMQTGRTAFAAAAARGDQDAAAEAFLRLWVDGPDRRPEQVDPAVRRHARAMALDALVHPALDGLDEAYDLPTPDQLRAIRVPALVMVGEHDLTYMTESADLLARGIPGAEHSVVAGAGHLANLEQPAAFNRAILDFLARHSGDSAW